jgi:hypothetical protein
MNQTAVFCRCCGQRIRTRDVMRTGVLPRQFAPSLVVIRYRCSRCRRLNEAHLEQEEWAMDVFGEAERDTNPIEEQEFEKLGPIEMHDLVEFHEALEQVSLKDLKGD